MKYVSFLAAVSKLGNVRLHGGIVSLAFVLWLIAIVLTLLGLSQKRYRARKNTRNRPFVDKPASKKLKSMGKLLARKKKLTKKRASMMALFLFRLLEHFPERYQKKALDRIIDKPLARLRLRPMNHNPALVKDC
uniref:Uncharacterized protein n=1 Tax=Candidatus Kentrum sp. SD TaxID=2126332 RepID=A0A450YKL6_9GAMM|nr:MAG: hypothetical protein BECKSD772F_GA0070984_10081 [Candidatus Kentron sp. SD]VFK42058.1 MAG: hypothetical protein BECKSD772E_GA0070983_101330 [Candidatus Kentron sp. SD]VFK78094.1 MAG: hypothetical protein BECKSD772D_GA0070982_10071 [Candidatus Kentron sp. SD]